jgi:hypothetical protein
VSSAAVVLFGLVAVAFVATLIVVFLGCRSVYHRSRALAQELTSLAAQLERTMDAVGQSATPARKPGN